MIPMFLQHISEANTANFGIKVRGDAVLDWQHIFYLILEADNPDKIQEFMTPFAQMGSAEVWPTNSCEMVVERGHC